MKCLIFLFSRPFSSAITSVALIGQLLSKVAHKYIRFKIMILINHNQAFSHVSELSVLLFQDHLLSLIPLHLRALPQETTTTTTILSPCHHQVASYFRKIIWVLLSRLQELCLAGHLKYECNLPKCHWHMAIWRPSSKWNSTDFRCSVSWGPE